MKLLKRSSVQNNKIHIAQQKSIYDAYVDRMYALCFRYLKNKEDAEECVTNGFLKIFQHQQNFEDRGEGSLERWMRTIMINECLMHLRKRKVFCDLDEKQEIQIEKQTTDHNIHYQEIYDLVMNLPPGYRTVFCLYHIEGYSHKEIAVKCGISENTSKSQLSKARNQLQQQLKQQEVVYEF
ncbi:MAG: sigma-70 family RNA polymerase sigma factor [Bacteroidales bacterium]|nr:sigma-70 family RNA polymerase sigma factor [Bacteroidales bacterium]